MPNSAATHAVSELATVTAEPGVPKPDPLLVADKVNRHFGGLVAVKEVDFRVEAAKKYLSDGDKDFFD